MRPKIKNDTFYLQTPEGIYFRNNTGWLRINGKVVYHWFERLAPYLNGQHTLEAMTENLPPEKQAMVTNLIHGLIKNGFIKDVGVDQPHTLSSAEEQTYATEIGFIDAFRDSAAHAFERFRESRILLVGSGLTITALVHANLRSGVRQIAVLTTAESATNTQRYAEYLELAHDRDPRQTLVEVTPPNWNDRADVAALLQSYDVIIHVSDRPMVARAQMLSQICSEQNQTLIQAVIIDGTSWLGPLTAHGATDCWECGWRRLQDNLQPAQVPFYRFEDRETGAIDQFITAPTAAFIANLLSFEVFKCLTQSGPQQPNRRLLKIELETLRTRRHTFLPHPLCHSCQQPHPPTAAEFYQTIQELTQAEQLSNDEFSRRAAACFDSNCGLFTSIDEHDFVQLPLHVAQVGLSNPMMVSHPREPATLVSVGTDFGMPRRQATQRACAQYAIQLVDERKLPPLDDTYRLPSIGYRQRTIDGAERWSWAYNLHTARVCQIPAQLVYPLLQGQRPSSDHTLGLGSGLSWPEAISQALITHCRALTIQHIPEAPAPFPQIDLHAIPLDADAARFRKMLDISHTHVTIYDVTGPLHVPTFAFCLDDHTIAYSTHVDAIEALRTGLEQAVQQYQSETHEQAHYRLPGVPPLPAAQRGTKAVMPVYETPLTWAERQTYLQQVLLRHGWQALACPLHHDPVLAQVLPFVVRVLLVPDMHQEQQ